MEDQVYQKLEEDEESQALHRELDSKITDVVNASLLAKVHLTLIFLVLAYSGVFAVTILCMLLSESGDSSDFIARMIRKIGISLALLFLFFITYPSGRELVRLSVRNVTLRRSPPPRDETFSSPILCVHFWTIVILAAVTVLFLLGFLVVCLFLNLEDAMRIFLAPAVKMGTATGVLVTILGLYPSGRRLMYLDGCRILAFLKTVPSWKSVIAAGLLVVSFFLVLVYV